MNTTFFYLFIVCMIIGFILIGYGDSKKKNATALIDTAWFTGLAILVLGFSFLIFSGTESPNDKEAIHVFWGLLFVFWFLGCWMISLDDYKKTEN